MEEMEDLVSTGQLAKTLNCDRWTVYHLVRDRRIPAYRLGRRDFRFHLSAVLAALRESGGDEHRRHPDTTSARD